MSMNMNMNVGQQPTYNPVSQTHSNTPIIEDLPSDVIDSSDSFVIHGSNNTGDVGINVLNSPTPATSPPPLSSHTIDVQTGDENPQVISNTVNNAATANPKTVKGRGFLSKLSRLVTRKKVAACGLIALGIALPVVNIVLAASGYGAVSVILIPVTMLIGAALISIGMDELDKEQIRDNKEYIAQLNSRSDSKSNPEVQAKIAKLEQRNKNLLKRMENRDDHSKSKHSSKHQSTPNPLASSPPSIPSMTKADKNLQIGKASADLQAATATGDPQAINAALQNLKLAESIPVHNPLPPMSALEKQTAINNALTKFQNSTNDAERQKLLEHMAELNSAPVLPLQVPVNPTPGNQSPPPPYPGNAVPPTNQPRRASVPPQQSPVDDDEVPLTRSTRAPATPPTPSAHTPPLYPLPELPVRATTHRAPPQPLASVISNQLPLNERIPRPPKINPQPLNINIPAPPSPHIPKSHVKKTLEEKTLEETLYNNVAKRLIKPSSASLEPSLKAIEDHYNITPSAAIANHAAITLQTRNDQLINAQEKLHRNMQSTDMDKIKNSIQELREIIKTPIKRSDVPLHQARTPSTDIP